MTARKEAIVARFAAENAKFSTAEIEEMIRAELSADFERMWATMTPDERLEMVNIWFSRG